MKRKYSFSQLTFIRLVMGFIRFLVSLGELEYRFFNRIFRRNRNIDYESAMIRQRIQRIQNQPIPRPESIKRMIDQPKAIKPISVKQTRKFKEHKIKKLRNPILKPIIFKIFAIILHVFNFVFIWPVKQVFNVVKFIINLIIKIVINIINFPKQIWLSLKNFRIKPQASFLKPVLSFAIIIILFILPLKLYDNYQFLSELKGKIINVSQAAIGDLFSAKSAIEDSDFNSARENFGQASANFKNAQNQLEVINDSLFVLAKIVPSQTIQLAGNSKHITRSGELASAVGANISAAINSLLINTNGKKFTEVLSDFSSYGHQALIKAEQLDSEINDIDFRIIPEEYQDEFIILRDQANFLQVSLTELLEISDSLQIFLGDQYDQRYLLVFQNNTEMRASGGFMGSFATVDFSRGEIKNIHTPKGGTYDTEAGLRVLVTAPKPLHLVNPLWHLWDSNWWPDWSDSAKKIMWFYEKSDGPTVDGVISLTPTVLERLLKVIGPIDMTEDYGVIIDADNFLMTIQKFAEQKPDETKEPKKIISDLLPMIIEKMKHNLDQDKLIELIGMIDSSLQEKHILLYFTDNKLQSKVEELSWAGRVKQTDMDYLQVVNTNIAGAKSDRDMEQRVYLNTTIRQDGTIVNDLTIERQHNSIKGEKFSGFRNVNWLRIYVPKGSQLISASGFRQPNEEYFEDPDPEWIIDPDVLQEEEQMIKDESTGTNIYIDGDKTVFANWSMVDPGDTAIIKLSYKLPFKILPEPEPEKILDKIKEILSPDDLYNYTLLVQSQPGSLNSNFYYNLDMQQNFETVWNYPKVNNYQLTTDKYWAYLFKGPDTK